MNSLLQTLTHSGDRLGGAPAAPGERELDDSPILSDGGAVVDVDFSSAVPLFRVDGRIAAIASSAAQLADTFRIVAPKQASSAATDRALEASEVLDELADEAWSLVGASESAAAKFVLRQLESATAKVTGALRRGGSPAILRRGLIEFFDQLRSTLESLARAADRRTRAAITALARSINDAERTVLAFAMTPRRQDRASVYARNGFSALRANVHALVYASLAPPTRPPATQFIPFGRTVDPVLMS